MDLGPTGWDRASRDVATRMWLDDVGDRIRKFMFWGRWQVSISLRDAYERGYDHGYHDGTDDAARPRSV